MEGSKRTDYSARGQCDEIYPSHGDPRLVAGVPVTDDILKCKLKPVMATDLPGILTSDDLKRLQEVFREGVCDYSAPGIG